MLTNMTTMLAIMGLAMAGYGEPENGMPTPDERLLHLWTNAVRVDPSAFKTDYQKGGCNFDNFKQTEKKSKPPLMMQLGLYEAARAHSQDMNDHNWFAHESSDGTSFFNRVAKYYPSSYVGENIAWNYPNPYVAVTQGWMCSSGHRSNIMYDDWNELGVGIVSAYYTQDFGKRDATFHPIAMGAHDLDGDAVAFYADYYDEEGRAPDSIVVVFDGETIDLELEYGTEEMGVWSTTEYADDSCHTYYFQVSLDGNSRTFPKSGQYGFGPCEFTDSEAGWLPSSGESAAKDERKGCNTSTGFSIGWLLVLPLCFRRLRPR